MTYSERLKEIEEEFEDKSHSVFAHHHILGKIEGMKESRSLTIAEAIEKVQEILRQAKIDMVSDSENYGHCSDYATLRSWNNGQEDALNRVLSILEGMKR